jgi:hypothetical protein
VEVPSSREWTQEYHIQNERAKSTKSREWGDGRGANFNYEDAREVETMLRGTGK